ncbi:MAG: hypothetical protein ACE5D3_04805 [Candidatus Binatia bacterium]
MADDETTNGDGEPQSDPTTDDATGDNGGATSDRVEFTAEQQGHIDRIVSDRLKRERQKWEEKLAQEREEAERKAEEERLAEEGKLKELLEKRDGRIGELEASLSERETQIQEQRLRFAIQEAASEQGLDFELAWRVIDHAGLEYDDDGRPTNVAKLLQRAVEDFRLTTAEQGGVPPTPRARGAGKLTDDERRKRAYFPRM